MSDWMPFWTEEVAIESGGRYPLLLNRFHDHLEDYLIKGIVSTTDRLRYISYCCWAIGDIGNSLKCEKYDEFEEAFRRRESALAIGIILANPKTDIGNYTAYGRDTLRGTVKDINKTYSTSVRIMPSSPLGAYGQYYKGTLQNWGLAYVGEDGIVHLTKSGTKLYRIMDAYYRKSKYHSEYKGVKEVPGKILRDWAELNHYDNITDNEHKAEREFFKDILFHLDTTMASDGRRDTLTIYIECIMELEKNDCEFDMHSLQDYMRNILYAQNYYDLVGNIYKFSVSSFLQNTRFIWMIYEIHVYYRWWIEEYFKAFLRLLAGSANGMSVEEIISSIDTDTFNAVIDGYLEANKDYFSIRFSDFDKHVIGLKDKNSDMIWEDIISDEDFSGFSEVAAGLIMMISLLNAKIKDIRRDRRFIEVRTSLTEDFWFKDIYENMDAFKEKPLHEVLKIILNQIVIRQHNKALFEKRDLRRCWFTLSADKYQFHADSTSIWRPAKHGIICNFLHDMGIIKRNGETFLLTSEGKNLYNKLKEDYYEK